MNTSDIKACIEAKEFRQKVSVYDYIGKGKSKYLFTIVANSVEDVMRYIHKKRIGSGMYTFKFLKRIGAK
jgi:hypothetical protein